MLTALITALPSPHGNFFYMRAVSWKSVLHARQYAQARMDVLFGSVSCMVIVFFIIVWYQGYAVRFRASCD